MKKKIIYGTIFELIVGTLLHFTYEWSGNNPIVGAFSAVNESTWEHLKLVFFPMLIITILGYFLTKNSRYLCVRTLGIVTSILFIIIFFYTYTGIIGTNFAFLDIGSFFVSIILGEYISYKYMISDNRCNKPTAIAILTVLTIAFITFTYITPKIGLFKDPVNNQYGIIK